MCYLINIIRKQLPFFLADGRHDSRIYYIFSDSEPDMVGTLCPNWARSCLLVADHILFPLSRQSPDVTIESMLYWLFSLS